MEVKFSRLLGRYIKKQLVLLGMMLLFAGIFFCVLFLSRLPVDATGYAFLLCICCWLLYAVIDFVRFYKRHQTLSALWDSITYGIDELPEPADWIEKEYQILIQKIHEDKIRMLSDMDKDRSEMMDYYTLWAHQIKTPIAAMRLLLQAESEGQNTQIEIELIKVEQYVEMVLSYLRIKDSTNDFVIREQPLDGIVKEAVRKYAKLFILKKISFSMDDIQDTIVTDAKWLVFVLEQILSNSLKYTKKGWIKIYMEPKKVLVIEDSGIGIAPEDIPRVFEKGFTGYNGREDKKSTGIGLYLCRKVLDKLGNHIDIESEVGTGTKVRIRLENYKITCQE